MGNGPCCAGRHSDALRIPDEKQGSQNSRSSDVLPDTIEFEGFKVVPKFWTIYAKFERMEKLTAALKIWRDLLGALNGISAKGYESLLEVAEVVTLVKTFLRHDRNHDRQLRWAAGEVRNFIRSSFKNCGLPVPPIGKNAWLLLYREYETEGAVNYDFKKSTAFLVHVAETIQALATGEALSVEVSPWVFMMWRPSEQKLEQVKADALADMRFWKAAEVFEHEGIIPEPERSIEKEEDADFNSEAQQRNVGEEPETEIPRHVNHLKDYWAAQALQLEKAWDQLKEEQQLAEAQKKQRDRAIKNLMERQSALKERQVQAQADAEKTAAERRDIRNNLSSLTAQLLSSSGASSPSNLSPRRQSSGESSPSKPVNTA